VSSSLKSRCNGRRMWQYLSLPRWWRVKDPHTASHQNCRHNVVDAINGRHYAVIPRCQRPELLDAAEKQLRKLSRAVGIFPGVLHPLTRQQVVDSRAAAKRKIFALAAESLEWKPLTAKDAKVKMFVKFEKGPQSKLLKKSPRLIQYRNTRFTLELARYLAPVEELLYPRLRLHGTKCFAKAQNTVQRAEEIVAAHGAERRYVMLDHSSWDGHVTLDMLKREHRYYLWLYRGDPYLAKLLQWQLTNKVGGLGVRFKVQGGRMSGDFNTALGNSIGNFMVLYAWSQLRGLSDAPEFHLCCDGDDSWMTIPAGVPLPTPKEFEQLGFTTKIEGQGCCPEDVEFCQMRPVQLSVGQWRMVRNPVRVFSRLPYSIQQYSGAAWPAYARGVGLCEKAMGSGQPIFQALADRIDRVFGEGRKLFDRDMIHRIRAEKCSITTDWSVARSSFWQAWGISPAEQEEMEGLLSVAPLTTTLTACH
jgi:hypothetical protein